jgi:hypothetical protein
MRTHPVLFFVLAVTLFSASTSADDDRPAECECYSNIEGIKIAQIAYDAAFDKYIEVPTWTPSSTVASTPRSWKSYTGFDTLGWGPDGKVRGRYKVAVAADGSDFTAYATCPKGNTPNPYSVVELTATKSESPSLPTQCAKRPKAERAESAPPARTEAVRTLTSLTASEKQGLVNIIEAVKASSLTNRDNTTPSTLLGAGLGYLTGREIFIREALERLGPKDLALGDPNLTSAIELCRRWSENPRGSPSVCDQWQEMSPNRELFDTVRSIESSDCATAFEFYAHASGEVQFGVLPGFAQRCGRAIGLSRESIFPYTPAELDRDENARLAWAAHHAYAFDFMLHAVRYLNDLPCETFNCPQVSAAAIQQLEQSIGFRLDQRLDAERRNVR